MNLKAPEQPTDKQQSRNRINKSGEVELESRVAQLHAELHGLIVMPADDGEIREAFRKRTMEYCRAVGVANVTRGEDGKWDLKPDHATGRVPRRQDFVERFARSCDATIERNTIQVESFLGLEAVFLPVHVNGVKPEVILVLTQKTEFEQTLFCAEVILEYFSIWLKDRSSTDNSWKLNSLAALIELVSAIESNDDSRVAAQTVVNELVRYLKCDHCVVATWKSSRLRIEAISGHSDADSKSEFLQANETALSECCLRNELMVHDGHTPEQQFPTRAHEQLARGYGFELIISTPLVTPDGKAVGALLIASNRGIAGERLTGFLKASSPRIASAFDLVQRAEISMLGRFFRGCTAQFQSSKGWIWMGLVVVMIGILCLPVTYRIRCNCVLNSAVKQYSVAPFDGVVKQLHVEPGDIVKKGQLLATMDGHSVRFRLAAIESDLAKARKQRDIELNRGNIPQSLVAELDARSLLADRQLLHFNESQIEIRSPIDAIVLAKQEEQTDGASVTMGEVLFELGTLDPLVVEVNIPADEIAHVAIGQTINVWVDGFGSLPATASVQKISPKSENRDGQNVFVAEIQLQNPGVQWRPGMQGHVRIDTEPKRLAWNLFHRPWDFMRSRLNWW